MSQVFDFDGPVQTPSPQVFVMETGGGGEGTPPAASEIFGIGGDGLTIETGLIRGVGLSQSVGLSKRID